jgi:uncharacterized membrane protein YfcA
VGQSPGHLALTIGIGFVSGLLSGMFGIGGGVITTPALRLLLGVPALIAVGTPLPVIIPSAITGAISYSRAGLADVRAGVAVGLSGSVFAVGGALLARRAGGHAVLVLTSALIIYMACDMLLQVVRGSGSTEDSSAAPPATTPGLPRLALVGAMTGAFSGFLGLGGGFVLVPLFTRWFRYPVKRAIATSLVAVGILAVPGSITHYLLGNVDLVAAGLLILGVIPGAFVGARVTIGASDRAVRVGFATLLACVGLLLAVSEIGWLA